MAAATLAEIRSGIAGNIADVFGSTVQVSAYEIISPNPPTIHVIGPSRIQYDQAGASGLDEWELNVQGVPSLLFDQGAQSVLDSWLDRGALSVKNAIEADRTLGGKVLDLEVTEAGNYRTAKLADGTVALTCEWQVRVLNRGA